MPEDVFELYTLINAHGDDTTSFLQGQLTQDILRLDACPALHSAWCNPKGRVIGILRLLAVDDGVGMVVHESLQETLLAKLGMYRMRSKVEFDVVDAGWRTATVAGDTALAVLSRHNLEHDASHAARHNRVFALRYTSEPSVVELFGPNTEIDELTADCQREDADAIIDAATGLIWAGFPSIDAENTEQFTPHMLNLDKLGAISFDKGCYTGQEIVARTEHRGKSRRRLARFAVESADVSAGDKLYQKDKAVGDVVNVAAGQLLAVIPNDLADAELAANGHCITPLTLPYELIR